jgi:quinol-cytochrome oxidoreductase complex cytochrome b subunit
LKISKGQSESIYRRTDNTTPKEKAEKDKQRSIKHTQKTSLRDLPLIFAFYCYFIFFYIYGAKVKIVEKKPNQISKIEER